MVWIMTLVQIFGKIGEMAFSLNFCKMIFFLFWWSKTKILNLMSWLLIPDDTQHDFLRRATFFQFFLSEGYLPLTPKINANSGKSRFSRFLLGDGKIGTFWYVCIRMNFSGFEALEIIENHYIHHTLYLLFYICPVFLLHNKVFVVKAFHISFNNE